LSALDSLPKSVKARFEQALLAAWYPSHIASTSRIRQDSEVDPLSLAIKGLVWLLTQSWFGLIAARLVAELAARRRGRRIINREQRPPVVVIGNLVAGGSGKTPLVIALAKDLSERGLKVAILCSDYGGRRKGHLQASGDWQGVEAWHSGWSDEATLLSMQSACPVFVDSDRSAALALCLSTQSHFDIILSDDGLQHHRLERTFEILLIDQRGFGNGKCLPAGPLREPLDGRQVADWVLVREHAGQTVSSNAPAQNDNTNPIRITALGRCYQALPAPMLRVMARSDWLIGSSESMTLAQFAQELAGKKLLGIAGIAQPQVLAASFAQLGFEVEWIFPGDHRAAELEANLNAPRRDVEAASGKGKDAIIMTAKDAVKYGDLGLPVFVLVQTLIAPEPLCIELERIARGQPTA